MGWFMSVHNREDRHCLRIGGRRIGRCRPDPQPEEIVAAESQRQRPVLVDARKWLAAKYITKAAPAVIGDTQPCGHWMLREVECTQNGFAVHPRGVAVGQLAEVGHDGVMVGLNVFEGAQAESRMILADAQD